MSALSHFADSSRTSRDVREVPIGDICSAANCTLFDYLVGTGKHTRRYFQAKCFGSLDVEHGFVFRRSLHRKVGWFLAFQDAVDVGGGKPIQRGPINPEGDQSAFGDETAEVMGSNGAMIVPQDIKPKQTVRQDFDNV